MDKKTKKQKEKIKHRAINWKLVSEFCRGTAVFWEKACKRSNATLS